MQRLSMPGSVSIALVAALLSPSAVIAMTIELAPGTAAVLSDGAWVVEAATVGLEGTTSAAGATAVQIDGADAISFTPADGSWEGSATLSPGENDVLVEALDASSAVVDSAIIEIIYVPTANHAGGALSADAVWSGAWIVDTSLTVPSGAILTIEAGTVVLCKPSVTLHVEGQLLAVGTEAQPVRFTHYGDGTTWERIIFLKAAESRFHHCVVEYTDSEGEHQDYYVGGSRDYHEAVVAVATDLVFEDCIFQKMPSAAGAAEGDAIAIISDDPDIEGEATAIVRRCEFLRIGQGVHERFSYVLVEDCLFTGKRGDNDDVDLWGESEPPPLIRNNLFINPGNDDAINPTLCSAIIVGNVIQNSGDHGMVLRHAGSPIVMNNLIVDCNSGGIAIENTCDALLVNNTILDCGRGLRLFDLGRWGSPYFLPPGGGSATVINCIIRDCGTSITLADSSNTSIPDRGSHITVLYSNVEGGEDGISVSGSQSTVTWGDGNIDSDPLFVDPGEADYRLQEGSPSIDAGTSDGAPPTDKDGRPRPQGAGFDMGAYEYEEPPTPVPFIRGDANADGGTDIADPVRVLLHLFAGGGDLACGRAGDADDSGEVDVGDAVYLLAYLFLSGPRPPDPHGSCGLDLTTDGVECPSFPPCQ